MSLTSKELDQAADLFDEGKLLSAYSKSEFDREEFKAYVTERPDHILVSREGDDVVGMLLFMINDGIFLKGTPVAVEIAWTVNEHAPNGARHWFKLLKMFEEKAKELGAHHCAFASYIPRMEKMYLKRGWVNDYKTFIKDLR